MTSDTSVSRYSTVASFQLLAAGHQYEVAQVAAEFLILDSPTDVPAGPATLVIRVKDERMDGEEELRREIEVLPAAGRDRRRVAIRR